MPLNTKEFYIYSHILRKCSACLTLGNVFVIACVHRSVINSERCSQHQRPSAVGGITTPPSPYKSPAEAVDQMTSSMPAITRRQAVQGGRPIQMTYTSGRSLNSHGYAGRAIQSFPDATYVQLARAGEDAGGEGGAIQCVLGFHAQREKKPRLRRHRTAYQGRRHGGSRVGKRPPWKNSGWAWATLEILAVV